MGAQLWHHAAPWRPDPTEALLDLQARFLAETYDLPSLVRRHLESAEEAVRVTEAEGDEYGLLDMYREELAMLEGIAGAPLPADAPGRIELVRKLYRYSGQGVSNVLDVTCVSGHRDYPTAARLNAGELERLAGTTRPTLAQARQAAYAINAELRRGECVCFPYHDDAGSEQPVGWYFVGNTID